MLLALVSSVCSQHYTNEERGMPISLFRFDPATLGIYNHAQANRNSYNRKKYKSSLHFSHGVKKGHVKSNSDNKVHTSSNSTKQLAGNSTALNETTKVLLNSNPSPNGDDAKKHLDDIKFDSTLQFNTSLTNMTLHNVTGLSQLDQTDPKPAKPTKELLFYRNKTMNPSDNAQKTTSIKLTKTTPAEVNHTVPIVKVYNTSQIKNESLLANNQNITMNVTSIDKTEPSKNDSLDYMAPKYNQTISSLKDNSSKTFNDTQKRNEIIAQYIPNANVSQTDKGESFQAGSRKHKVHQMFPECYHCDKNSNYTDCVMKSKLVKCDKGLNNICFARSYKKKNDKRITYEMGCINHRQCLKARPFPCRG